MEFSVFKTLKNFVRRAQAEPLTIKIRYHYFVDLRLEMQNVNQYFLCLQVSEDNTASLFANSIMSSTAQVDNWSHVNGPETKWGRTSPKEEPLYRPEKYASTQSICLSFICLTVITP